MDVELRHLRAFVAVAEELSFTRAAKRLFLAQQALSAQIRQLEERLGVQLLTRTTRRVELTEAGGVLYQRAIALLASVDELVSATRSAAGGRPGLTVGFVAPVDHPAMGAALAVFAERRPDVDVSVHYGDLLDPTGGLRDRKVDVAFVYGPFDTSGLELRLLFTEPRGVAIATDHRFAELDEVPVADVVAEPTFDFPTPDRRWRAFWEAAEHRVAPPTYVAQFRSLDALIQAIRSGLGVHIATRPLVETTGASTGVTWRPVRGLAPLEHYVAWRREDDRELTATLVAATVDAFAVTSPEPGTGSRA
jgi:DNA-binding transcriptional LysR family regulator